MSFGGLVSKTWDRTEAGKKNIDINIINTFIL